MLADLGYEGEADLLTIAHKKPAGGNLTVDQQAYNALHAAMRAVGERAHSLLKDHLQGITQDRLVPAAHR